MSFAVRDDGVICLHTEFPGVPHDQNLIVKAAKKLQEQSGCTLGIDIRIKKVLPMGGVSAAAAQMLQPPCWGSIIFGNWPGMKEQLAALGLSLGADVPVFVRGHAAFAEGIGEILTPAEPEEPWYLVLVPQVSVSTAEIFSDPLLTRDSLPIKVRPVPKGNSRNDCEAVVKERYPEVRNALNLLGKYTEAKLTGTGSCIFGAFPTKQMLIKCCTF
ncbi:4-(cytidine 5'-diphospho)-2-C-methyl-D-erythritol kinase [Pseudomonas deceptionensis]|uniref:4-(cytidine 5'-diphospho)-2-C-methyl-D-erythritol kinase n=1 Tax=Pseudomonas deceptionensis TaxID=882211 RepID=UPI000941D57D|nr:4-(cytidine 5'-diphospho)-2-C-methyl-D-erythritol kinase [Pseudomonas deceptionensis]